VKQKFKHPWKLTPPQARELQSELSAKVESQPPFNSAEEVRTLAALDVAYGEKSAGEITAAAVLYDVPSLKILEKSVVTKKADGLFPYVPGLLSFREAPLLVEALKKIKRDPDVLLIDGQGLAHPRRFGLACHVGFLMDKPSVGCAKSWLFGDYEEPPPGLSGAYTFLRDGDQMIGVALRSRPFVEPVFVSPGHKMSVLMAVDIVMLCVRENRLPEPLREADRLTRVNERPRKKR
jgi:deoxyribonuclease V